MHLFSPNAVFRAYLRKSVFCIMYLPESCHCNYEFVLVFITAEYSCFVLCVSVPKVHRYSSTLHTGYIKHNNILTHSTQQKENSLTLHRYLEKENTSWSNT